MKKDPLADISMEFGIEIIQLYKSLKKDSKEFELSKQIVRSGTSIGASIREAKYAESKKDFIHKLRIAVKEANETQYWLSLLLKTKYIDAKLYESLNAKCHSLLNLLIASINTSSKGLD